MDTLNTVQLTERDLKIINDLSIFPMLPAKIICDKFFNNYKTGMKRLKVLQDSTFLISHNIGKFKHISLNSSARYIVKKPLRKIDNALSYVKYAEEYKIYNEISKYGILTMFPEYPVDTFAYLYSNEQQISYLIHLDLVGDNLYNIKMISEYEKNYKNENYKKFYPKHPRMLLITASKQIQRLKEEIKDYSINKALYISHTDDVNLFNKAIWNKYGQMDKIKIDL